MLRRLVALFFCLLLGGCSALPAEDRSFAVALGIARSEDRWQVAARVPAYQQGGGYLTLKAEGTSLQEAMASLDASAPMRVYCGQVRLIVFQQALAASEDMPRAVTELAKRPDMRLQAQLCVTNEDMAEFMDALEPETGSRLSKSIDLLLETRRELGTIPEASVSQWMRAGERQNMVLLSAGLRREEDEEKDKNQPKPGKILVEGGWLMNAQGRSGGYLSAQEMQMLSILQGTLHRATVMVKDKTMVISGADSKIRLDGNLVRCTVKLRCTTPGQTADEAAAMLQAELQGLTDKLMAADCDALGLGRQAIRHFRDVTAWKELNWPGVYQGLTWDINVKVQPPA